MSIRTRLKRLEKARGWTADVTWMYPVYDDDDSRADVLAAYSGRRLPPQENIGFVRLEGLRPATPDPSWPKPLDDVSDADLERTVNWLTETLRAEGYEVEPDGPNRCNDRFLHMSDGELVAESTKGTLK